MKSLQKMLLEANILEATSNCENYDDVIKLAKANDTFTKVKSFFGSRGRAFELTLGTLTLHVEFLGYEECLYSFLDKSEEEIYGIHSTIEPYKVDWQKLFNDPKGWCDDKIDDMNDNLKSTDQKIKAAERTYNRTGKSDDANKLNSLKSFRGGIEKAISTLTNLKKLL